MANKQTKKVGGKKYLCVYEDILYNTRNLNSQNTQTIFSLTQKLKYKQRKDQNKSHNYCFITSFILNIWKQNSQLLLQMKFAINLIKFEVEDYKLNLNFSGYFFKITEDKQFL